MKLEAFGPYFLVGPFFGSKKDLKTVERHLLLGTYPHDSLARISTKTAELQLHSSYIFEPFLNVVLLLLQSASFLSSNCNIFSPSLALYLFPSFLKVATDAANSKRAAAAPAALHGYSNRYGLIACCPNRMNCLNVLLFGNLNEHPLCSSG